MNAQDFMTFALHWLPTEGKNIWPLWLAKHGAESQVHHVMPDFEPFMDTTGTHIKGRAHWRDHLKRTNGVELSHSDIPKAHEYKNPSARPIEQAGRKEALKLAMDKITKYKRPASEVRALMDNVVKANRRK